MTHRTTARLFLTTLCLAACSDPQPSSGTGSTTGASDSSVSFDTTGIDTAKADVIADLKFGTQDAAAIPTDTPSADDNTVASDGSTPSDTLPSDSVLTGNFGAPCTTATDCDSGMCVEDKDGKVCTKLCQADCPSGYTCAGVKSGSSDVTFVCVPTYARLCNPCGSNGDCNPPGVTGGLCLAKGKDGSFCALQCQPGESDSCPSGYSCKSALGGNACQPTSGVCACSGSASAKQLSTACSTENAIGTCLGTRVCQDGKLSDCSALVASAELCDGLDNDCNGTLDDIAASACETSNEFGTCKGKTTGCAASGPSCNASTAKPETCNQQDDNCNGQTDEGLCEDGNACTTGACNPDGSCQQTPTAGACDDGNVCTLTDSCATGACQGSGTKVCDDANPCTADFCDPKTGCSTKVADPGTACKDDGNPCTLDQCEAGKCAHPNAPGTVACQDDGNPCTSDQCAGGLCDHPGSAAGSPCPDDGKDCTDDTCNGLGTCSHPASKLGTACLDDGDPCTGDSCDGAGVCTHPIGTGTCKIGGKCVAANALNPANPCQACVPSVLQTGYSDKDGLTCSDGNGCTTSDTCKAGSCKGTQKSCTSFDSACSSGQCSVVTGNCASVPKAGGVACSDGNSCTSPDTCDGTGKCAGKAVDCSALSDGCNTGVCSAGGCLKQQKPANTGCSDNNTCTSNDVCTAGVCIGKAIDCSSKTDACNTGICSAGACVAQAKANNTVCDDGTPCTVSDKCTSGKCAGTSTADSSEPNNSAPGKTLADKSDCDALSQLTATISPSSDVDWYFFNSQDKAGCTVKPQAKIENLAADYELCVWFVCGNGSTGSDTVSCANGTKTSGGPSGSFGCCSKNAGTVAEFAKVSPSCSFLGTGNDGGKTWVQVTAKSGAMCGGYTLWWGAKN